MTLARVFPRRTKATPHDEYAFIGDPPLLAMPERITEVHVSVTFTWDLPEAHRLVRAWEVLGVPVRIGGPACGTRGDEFVPGRYLATGYTITSRGCPKRCWFCSVHKRDGGTRELPIHDGWNVLDDNLLACSEAHTRAVFDMLYLQKHRVEFTGGIDASLLAPWSAVAIAALHPQSVFLAYDEPADLPHVERAVRMLLDAGMSRAGKRIRCYVLCAYDGDTISAAEERCSHVLTIGAVPFPMQWIGEDGRRAGGRWPSFARRWCRPAMVSIREATANRLPADLLKRAEESGK